MPLPARFECYWKPSRTLLIVYSSIWLLALAGIFLTTLPVLWQAALLLCGIIHAFWVLPRHIRLHHNNSWRGLRHDTTGWHLYSKAAGWQRVRLRADTLVLPALVIVRFMPPGSWFPHSIAVAADMLDSDSHRRLRLLLRFNREKQAASE